MKIKNLITYILIGSEQNYRVAEKETKKMLPKIQFTSDNYDIDNRINYLIDNNIKIKYKVI